MFVNPKQVIVKLAYKLLGDPMCDQNGIQIDDDSLSLDGYPYVVKFNWPGNGGMAFRLVFNKKGEFLGFTEGNAISRKLTLREDGTFDPEGHDIEWFHREMEKRSVNLYQVVTKLMSSEKAMESNRGANYYEQFPKATLRDIPEEQQTFGNPIRNYLIAHDMPITDENVSDVISKNRAELLNLTRKGYAPDEAIKYIFSKSGDSMLLDTDDIFVQVSRQPELKCTLGSMTPEMAKLLMQPLTNRSGIVVDVGYMQDDTPVKFYRLAINDGNVSIIRFAKPDAEGRQRLSQVVSSEKLEDFSKIGDWISNTVSNTYEVDPSLDNNPENYKLDNGFVYTNNNVGKFIEKQLQAIEAQRQKKNIKSDDGLPFLAVGTNEFKSDARYRSSIISNIVSNDGSDRERRIVFSISDRPERPVAIVHAYVNDSYSKSNYLNLDVSKPAYVRYLQTYGITEPTYGSASFSSFMEALAFAQKVSVLNAIANDFIDGIHHVIELLNNSENTYIQEDCIQGAFDIKVQNNGLIVCTLSANSDQNTQYFGIIVQIDGKPGSYTVDAGFRVKLKTVRLDIKNLDMYDMWDKVANADQSENTVYSYIKRVTIPLMSTSDYGSAIKGKDLEDEELMDKADANRKADMERRKLSSVNLGPEIDDNTYIEQLDYCRKVFEHTFMKYSAYFELSGNHVIRNPKNYSIVEAWFTVDPPKSSTTGQSGTFKAMPVVEKRDGKTVKTKTARIYCTLGDEGSKEVTYDRNSGNADEVFFSNDFIGWYVDRQYCPLASKIRQIELGEPEQKKSVDPIDDMPDEMYGDMPEMTINKKWNEHDDDYAHEHIPFDKV